jgi:cyclic pyranopterin phosphate synthase
MTFLPRAQVLTLEEIARLGRCFSELGVTKLRITGGEPLVRRNVLWLFEQLGALPGIRDLTLTTNGTQLPRYAQALKAPASPASTSAWTPEAGALPGHHPQRRAEQDPGRHRRGAGRGLRAHQAQQRRAQAPQPRRGGDLVRFALERGMDISFIEEMPLGVIGDHDRAEAYYSSDEIRRDLGERFELIPTTETTGGPSRYWPCRRLDNRVGFISPHSHNFCGDCNRVRVTAEGRLLLCLGQEFSTDLRRALRANPADDDSVKQAIRAAMSIKPRGHDFDLTEQPIIFRHMNATGG